jgi:radical SAM superfamily enzyme YgiQ (UPF0313 family)
MRIGLIAMSGVRACDPELVRLGMTLPGFLERGKVIASLPSLGLLTLAGMTPSSHTCEYHEVKEIRDFDRLPDAFDLVAISSLRAQINETYDLADRYRAIGVPVVLGGLHVTALPEEAGRHADAVVVGEGEPVWLEVLKDAEAGRLRHCYQARGDFSLADSPIPAFELLDLYLSFELANFHIPEINLGRLDFERNPAPRYRFGAPRLLGIGKPDLLPSIDHMAVQDVYGRVVFRDYLDRVPAVDLKSTRQPLLVPDSLSPENS